MVLINELNYAETAPKGSAASENESDRSRAVRVSNIGFTDDLEDKIEELHLVKKSLRKQSYNMDEVFKDSKNQLSVFTIFNNLLRYNYPKVLILIAVLGLICVGGCCVAFSIVEVKVLMALNDTDNPKGAKSNMSLYGPTTFAGILFILAVQALSKY